MRIFVLSFILLFSLLLLPLYGQQLVDFVPMQQYTCLKTETPPKIDGDLQDSVWEKAHWSEEFTDIADGPTPYRKTQFKMLWDDQYLYLAAWLEEPDLWATLTKRDAIIYWDNDFEVFIDPDGDSHNYLEIEVNAFNTIFDLMLVKPYRNGGPMVIGWDLADFKSAVQLQGSLNDNRDRDSSWTIEMAIPLHQLVFNRKGQLPAVGVRWYINFSRVHWDLEKNGLTYQKKKNPTTQKNLPEHNWVWSKQGKINMHMPEKWGYLNFVDTNGNGANKDLTDEKIKWILRQLYERQEQYFRKNKKYAESLRELGLNALKLEGKPLPCKFYCSPIDFLITVQYNDVDWHIRSDSKVWKQ